MELTTFKLKEGQELLDAKLIFEEKSNFQTIKLYDFETNKIMLTLDTYIQFISGKDEEEYHCNLIDKPIDLYYKNIPKDVLILGGGDGLCVRNLLNKISKPNITLVELDDRMIDLFMSRIDLIRLNEKSLFSNNLKIIIGDAKNYVRQYKNYLYDFIVCDFPDSTSDVLEELYSVEFYSQVVKLLKNNGIISIQSNKINTEKIKNNLKDLIKKTEIINYKMPFLGEADIVVGIK